MCVTLQLAGQRSQGCTKFWPSANRLCSIAIADFIPPAALFCLLQPLLMDLIAELSDKRIHTIVFLEMTKSDCQVSISLSGYRSAIDPRIIPLQAADSMNRVSGLCWVVVR